MFKCVAEEGWDLQDHKENIWVKIKWHTHTQADLNNVFPVDFYGLQLFP